MLVWALSGHSSLLPQSKDLHVRLIGDSKLSVDVNVSMNDCLFLCVSLSKDCKPVQGVPRLLSHDSWDRLQPPRYPDLDKLLRKWKDGKNL